MIIRVFIDEANKHKIRTLNLLSCSSIFACLCSSLSITLQWKMIEFGDIKIEIISLSCL